MSSALEESVESFLIGEVGRRGGFTLKLHPVNAKGVPDRLVVLPNVPMFVVELKRPKGGRVAALQTWWAKRFTDIGHAAHIANTKERVTQVLDEQSALAIGV